MHASHHNKSLSIKSTASPKGQDDVTEFLAMSPSEYVPTFATVMLEDVDAEILREHVSKMWDNEMDEWSVYMYGGMTESSNNRGRLDLKDKKRFRSKSRKRNHNE